MPPSWLTTIAWTAIGVAVVCTGWIAYDLFVRGHRQHMRVYWGPVAVWGHRRFGWPKRPQWRAEHG